MDFFIRNKKKKIVLLKLKFSYVEVKTKNLEKLYDRIFIN